MVYLINHLVLFNTLEYQLTLLKDKRRTIKLSNTAGRVLEELIMVHGGEAVTRETLFERVWEANGLQPSNGNLNQQISLIRKALISLGLESTAIVTLPKRGLKLNDHLTVSDYHPPATPAVASPELPEAAKDSASYSTIFTKIRPTSSLVINILLIMIFIIGLPIMYFYVTPDDKQPLFFFRKIDTCDVYTLRPVNERDQADLAARVQRTMIDNIDSCDDRHIVMFSRTAVANPRMREQINRRTFLAKCEKNARGALSECQNFYFYNWGNQ